MKYHVYILFFVLSFGRISAAHNLVQNFCAAHVDSLRAVSCSSDKTAYSQDEDTPCKEHKQHSTLFVTIPKMSVQRAGQHHIPVCAFRPSSHPQDGLTKYGKVRADQRRLSDYNRVGTYPLRI